MAVHDPFIITNLKESFSRLCGSTGEMKRVDEAQQDANFKSSSLLMLTRGDDCAMIKERKALAPLKGRVCVGVYI